MSLILETLKAEPTSVFGCSETFKTSNGVKAFFERQFFSDLADYMPITLIYEFVSYH